jgi:hypothetical protein
VTVVGSGGLADGQGAQHQRRLITHFERVGVVLVLLNCVQIRFAVVKVVEGRLLL